MVFKKLEIIKCADHIINSIHEAGKRDGEIVATGTSEEIARNENSWIGKYLKDYLD